MMETGCGGLKPRATQTLTDPVKAAKIVDD
jgi:hypothetical protein